MGSWRFTDVTQDYGQFWPLIRSLSISNAQPCDLAVLTATIVDEAAVLTMANKDELIVEYADNEVDYVTIFAGDLNRVLRKDMGRVSPRVYELTAQDYTKRLGDNVIDANRTVEETVSNRIDWIMGHSTQGITTTNVATITDLMDPRDYRGLSVRAALEEVAGEVGGSFYVDFDKDLHFFVTPPVVAAPFDLTQDGTGTPYWNFEWPRDTDDYAEGVYVKGEGVAVWRGTQGTYERSYSDPSITTSRQAARVGDALLDVLSNPIQSASLVITTPGLKPGMTATVQNTDWDAEAEWPYGGAWLVRQTNIAAIDPNGAGGGKMEMTVQLVDRFTPCFIRSPNLAQGATTPGDDCTACAKQVALLPSGFEAGGMILARGQTGTHVYDGTRLAHYRCDLTRVRTNDSVATAIDAIYHEPFIETPLIGGDVGLYLDEDLGSYGEERWDNGINAIAADVTDRRQFWVVADGSSFVDLFNRSTSSPVVGNSWGGASQGSTTPDLSGGTLQCNGSELHWTGGTEFEMTQQGSGPWNVGLDRRLLAKVKFIYVGAGGSARLMVWGYRGTSEPVNCIVRQKSSGAGGGWELEIGTDEDAQVAAISTPTTDTWYYLRWEHLPSQGTSKARLWLASGSEPGTWDVEATTGNESSLTSGFDELSLYGLGGQFKVDEVTLGSGRRLQSRSSTTGALVADVGLPLDAPTALRRSPNGQHVYVIQAHASSALYKYSRVPALEDTSAIWGFDYTDPVNGFIDWNVDDEGNVYTLWDVGASYEVQKQHFSGGAVTQTGLGDYKPPSLATAFGNGQILYTGRSSGGSDYDANLRIVGYEGEADWADGSQAALVTVRRSDLAIVNTQLFGGLEATDAAQAIAVHRTGGCIVMVGAAAGDTFEELALTGTQGWIMRLPAG